MGSKWIAMVHYVRLRICDVYLNSSVSIMKMQKIIYDMGIISFRWFDFINGIKDPESVLWTLTKINQPLIL